MMRCDLTEWGSLCVPEWRGAFPTLSPDRRRRLEQLVRLGEGREGEVVRLTASSRVGVVETGGVRVQVVPRLAPDRFLALVRFALGDDLQDHRRDMAHSRLDWGEGFENVLGTLLVREATRVMRGILSRRYLREDVPERGPRGRILWTRNFPWQGSRARTIVCRQHRLDADTLDNRLLLAGVASAMSRARGRTRQQLLALRGLLSELAGTMRPSAQDFALAARSYTRLTRAYAAGHALSRLFCLSRRPDSLFDGADALACDLVLDMAELFEGFIVRLLRETLEPHGVRVVTQHSQRAVVDDADCRYADIRPDVELWRGGVPLAVVDAKYKEYWPMDARERPLRKVAMADFYQILYYRRFLAARRPDAFPLAVLASPLPGESARGERWALAPRLRTLHHRAEGQPPDTVSLWLPCVEAVLEDAASSRSLRKHLDFPLDALARTVY